MLTSIRAWIFREFGMSPAGTVGCGPGAVGLPVGFTTAAALVHELHEARDEKRLLRLQHQLAGYKLLIVDELGYVPLSPTGAELLFDVFSQRYERGWTIVTSNQPFDEWTTVFASERLTGALLDRLTHLWLPKTSSGVTERDSCAIGRRDVRVPDQAPARRTIPIEITGETSRLLKK
jgi:hypothetical protein